MQGYLYIEEELLGRLNGTYVKRYFITYNYCGIKWFLKKPSNTYDLHYLQYLVDDSSCGWLYGGTIIPHSVESSSIDSRNHDGTLLYLFKLIVKSQNSSATVILATDSDNDRKLWIDEIKLSMRHLIYVSICMKSDYVPRDVLFQMIQHRFDEYLHIHDIVLTQKIISIIFDFYMVMMPHGFMLEAISFDNTQLNDNMLKTLCSLVSHALYVKKLSITRNTAVSSDGMTGLLYELTKRHKFLVHLDVSFNNLDDTCMPALVKTIKCLINLQYFDISHNLFTQASTQILSHRLATFHSKLTYLNVSHNSLGDGIATAVSLLLFNQPSILERVDLSYCGITEIGINEISLAIKSCSTLKSISLNGLYPSSSTALRSLVKAVTAHHDTYGVVIAGGGKEGMSLRMGGITHDTKSSSSNSLSLHSLKASLMYTSDIAHMEEVVMRKRLILLPNGSNLLHTNKHNHHHYPILTFDVKLPSSVKSPVSLLEELAIYIHSDPSQFMILSCAKMGDNTEESRSGTMYKLVFTIIDGPTATERITARLHNSYLYSMHDVVLFGIDTHAIMKEYVHVKHADNDHHPHPHHTFPSSSSSSSSSTLPSKIEKGCLYAAARLCSMSKLLSTIQFMAETSDPFLRYMGVTTVDMRYMHPSTIDWETPEYVDIHATIRNPSSYGKGIDDAYVYTFSSREKVDAMITANSQLNHSFPSEDTDDDDCIDISYMNTIIIEQNELHSSLPQVNDNREEKSRDPEPRSSSSSAAAAVLSSTSSVVGRGVMGDRQHDASRGKNRATNERLIHAVRDLYKTGAVSFLCLDTIVI